MGQVAEELLCRVVGSQQYLRELEALILALEERAADQSKRWNALSWLAYPKKIISNCGQPVWDGIICEADRACQGTWACFEISGAVLTTKAQRDVSHARAQIGIWNLIEAFAEELNLLDPTLERHVASSLEPIRSSMRSCLDRVGGFCRVVHDLVGSASRVIAMSAVATARDDEDLALRLVRFVRATWAEGLIPLDIGRIGDEYRFQLLSR